MPMGYSQEKRSGLTTDTLFSQPVRIAAPKSPFSYARINLLEAIGTLILQSAFRISSIPLRDC